MCFVVFDHSQFDVLLARWTYRLCESGPDEKSIIVKNLIGYTLILGGILMLVLPGQGLFTILMGLILSNYPGKYSIERKFISMPSVLKTVNWLRKKSDKPPLQI